MRRRSSHDRCRNKKCCRSLDAVPTAIPAALPVVIILVLMLAFRWSAARAGLLGLLLTLAIALFTFGYGRAVYPELGRSAAVFGSLLEASFIAATILWIIFPALAIYQLQLRTGALDTLQKAIGRVTSDRRLLALIVAWFFALFLEGAAGFGIPVALAAPFLVSAGFSPVAAVVIALVGHAVGVSFGAVGTPVLPQMAATGLGGRELARAAGTLHGLVGWLMPLALMLIVSRSLPPDENRGGWIWGWTMVAGALFLVPYFAISRWVGPELPTLGSALAGGVLFVLLLRRFGKRGSVSEERPAGAGALLRAGAPYLALVAIILATRLIDPVRMRLTAVVWEWELFEVFTGRIQPLYHPGTILLAAFFLGALWQRASGERISGALARAIRQIVPVTVALFAMLGLSRTMVHSGMIDSLATAAAATAGAAWPLLIPLVGVLGSFVTGSATASNVLFTDFQQATATQLDLPVVSAAGGQNFGAAVGNIICPHNIVAAGATVDLRGREGDVLRSTLWICIAYALLGGIVVFLLI
jgi:lactate permease